MEPQLRTLKPEELNPNQKMPQRVLPVLALNEVRSFIEAVSGARFRSGVPTKAVKGIENYYKELVPGSLIAFGLPRKRKRI